MNTAQSNNPSGSGASAVKPTDRSWFDLKLSFGLDVEVVYRALADRRDKSIEAAAFQLAERDVEEYLETVERLELIHHLMDTLFKAANDQMDKVNNSRTSSTSITKEKQRRAEQKQAILSELDKMANH